MKADYHIHTEDSYDSTLTAESIIKKAIGLDYDLLAITEHLDLLPQEMGKFGTPSLTRYLTRLDKLIDSYTQITILKGIEVGDFHQHRDFAQRLLDMYEFELVLGSVHFLEDHTNLAIPIQRPMGVAELTEYYKANLQLVETCNIDVLAHLGVYKRFYTTAPDESIAQPIIKDIFSAMIDRQIALELNYSCVRKVYQSIIPEMRYIDLYLDLGGRLFTIASDAHHLDHFEDGWHLLPEDLIANLEISNRTNRVLELIRD